MGTAKSNAVVAVAEPIATGSRQLGFVKEWFLVWAAKQGLQLATLANDFLLCISSHRSLTLCTFCHQAPSGQTLGSHFNGRSG